jgi:hypothetical protein
MPLSEWKSAAEIFSRQEEGDGIGRLPIRSRVSPLDGSNLSERVKALGRVSQLKGDGTFPLQRRKFGQQAAFLLGFGKILQHIWA